MALKKIDGRNGRFYTDGEDYYPSVTTILNKVVAKGYYFKKWLGDARSWKDAEEYRDSKAKKGTKVHNYCERLAKGDRIDVSEDSKEVVKKTLGYIKWYNKMEPNIIDTEFQVVNRLRKYAGTADLIAEIDEDVWLIDIKTSSQIYNSHKFQLSMYNKAISTQNDDLGAVPRKQGILLLKDRTKKGYQLKEIEYDPGLVDAVMALYERVGDWEPAKEEKLPQTLEIEGIGPREVG